MVPEYASGAIQNTHHYPPGLVVVFILSSTLSLSFWLVFTTAAMQATLAAQFVDAKSFVWFIPTYTTVIVIAFILAHTNSGIFDRHICYHRKHHLRCPTRSWAG